MVPGFVNHSQAEICWMINQNKVLNMFVFDENYLFHRYAILFPLNSYGEKLAKEFSIIAMERGKEIVAEVSYEPGKADFKYDILKRI